jgi:hypothetical protein
MVTHVYFVNIQIMKCYSAVYDVINAVYFLFSCLKGIKERDYHAVCMLAVSTF